MKINFPQFKTKYPNILNIGFTDNKTRKRKLTNDSVLVILDVTGSMGDYLNNQKECSKANAVKKVLTKIKNLGYTLDILPFNTITHSICNIENIPEPNELITYNYQIVTPEHDIITDNLIRTKSQSSYKETDTLYELSCYDKNQELLIL